MVANISIHKVCSDFVHKLLIGKMFLAKSSIRKSVQTCEYKN